MRSKTFLIRSAIILFTLPQFGFACLFSSEPTDPDVEARNCADLAEAQMRAHDIDATMRLMSMTAQYKANSQVILRANEKNAFSQDAHPVTGEIKENTKHFNLYDVAVNGQLPDELTNVTWKAGCDGKSPEPIEGPSTVSTKP